MLLTPEPIRSCCDAYIVHTYMYQSDVVSQGNTTQEGVGSVNEPTGPRQGMLSRNRIYSIDTDLP